MLIKMMLPVDAVFRPDPLLARQWHTREAAGGSGSYEMSFGDVQ